jgi:hypothetical protein
MGFNMVIPLVANQSCIRRNYNKPTSTPTLSQVFSAISKGAILFIARVTFDRSDISAMTYYSEIEPSFVRAQLDF